MTALVESKPAELKTAARRSASSGRSMDGLEHPWLSVDQAYEKLVSADPDLAYFADFTRQRPTRAERLTAGKAIRKIVPRRAIAVYKKRSDRPDPVALLQRQNATRVRSLVPVRMSRMLASPFSFYRGAAALMASDLAPLPTTNLGVVACGDMHIANFGLFASAERKLIFAINDFDEVHPAPWEWDLERLAASAAIAASFTGGDRVDAERIARAAAESYAQHISRYSEMGFLETWYDVIAEQTILGACPPRLKREVSKAMDKARSRGHVRALGKLTEEVDGEHRISEAPPLIVRETHLSNGRPISDALNDMLRAYLGSLSNDKVRLLARYRLVDAARKVVGVGSVGTRCWVLLFHGLDDGDPLFLQIKEATRSVLAPYVKVKLRLGNQGERVVTGQRLIQGSPDILLGWGAIGEAPRRSFYVRQLADMKGGATFSENDRDVLESLEEYCRLCGWALALAHAKSGDAATISGYCGSGRTLADMIGRFALSYMDQNEADFDRVSKAARQGAFQLTKSARS